MGSFTHYPLESKTNWNESFRREIRLHIPSQISYLENTDLKMVLRIVFFVEFCFCVKIYGIRQTDTSFIGLKSCVEKVVFFKCLI